MENMAETQIYLYMEESQVKMTALFGPMINVGSGVLSFILMIPATLLMGQ